MCFSYTIEETFGPTYPSLHPWARLHLHGPDSSSKSDFEEATMMLNCACSLYGLYKHTLHNKSSIFPREDK